MCVLGICFSYMCVLLLLHVWSAFVRCPFMLYTNSCLLCCFRFSSNSQGRSHGVVKVVVPHVSQVTGSCVSV